MQKQVLINYHKEDKTFKTELQKWLEHAGFKVVCIDEALLAAGQTTEDLVVKKIVLCDILLMLIGASSTKRPWVNFAIKVSGKPKRPAFCILIKDRKNGTSNLSRKVLHLDYNRETLLHTLKHL